MIISASRRTDLPAFYSEWFFNRLKEGFALTRNPMNLRQISRISLKPCDVDCIVFWTKNPEPMLSRIGGLIENGYDFYFQFTLTPYGSDIEPGLPDKERLVGTFQELSRKIGKERVVWRYDPILSGGLFTAAYHGEQFKRLCSDIAPYTDECIFSFVDRYAKAVKNAGPLLKEDISEDFMLEVAGRFAETASGYGLRLNTCCESIDLSGFGIGHAACIDEKRIKAVTGRKFSLRKDRSQRAACGCAESRDIGAYDSCPHGCAYCYANRSREVALRNNRLHDPNSPLLLGKPDKTESGTLHSLG